MLFGPECQYFRMPYTVPISFEKFVENISLTGDHKETADTPNG